MKLARLLLTNFRNYQNFSHELGQTTLLIGPNGAGKTNVLEAIYMLAILRSYRATTDTEVIRFGQDFAKIVGSIETNGSQTTVRKASDELRVASRDELEIVVGKGTKKAKKNGVIKPLSQLIGTLKAVLFSPEQIDIIIGPPRRRRRFMDSLLSQVDRRYAQALLEYQKALQNRNALLASIKKEGSSAAELFFWDKQLIETGTTITHKRHQLISFLNQHLSRLYQSLAATAEPLEIVPKFDQLSHELFRERLVLDIQMAATTAGPHRDNFIFQLGKYELGLFGSRGEWRTALFALKNAEALYHHHETGSDPILLFDDVFSELDSLRRRRLLDLLTTNQTFVTATDLTIIPATLRDQGRVIEVAAHAQAST
jgi:DNA replication and repair protein RecF